MDRLTLGILLTDLALIAGFCYLLSRAERSPRAYWRFLFSGIRSGSRTYADEITSSALFYSGLWCITWSFIFFAVFMVAGIVTGAIYDWVQPNNFFLGVIIVSLFFCAMSLVAGVEHLVRSFFRRKKQVPPGVK
jgi:hypothetical protein